MRGRTSQWFNPWRSLFAGVWGWLVVLIVFSVTFNLLIKVPGVVDVIAEAIEGGEPDNLIGSIIYQILTLVILLVLALIKLLLSFAWNVIAFLLAALISYLICSAILTWLSKGLWPKRSWIAVGSLITLALVVFVYLVPVQSLFEPYIVSSDSILQKLTSLPFNVTGVMLATLSIPFLMRWARLSSDDIFP